MSPQEVEKTRSGRKFHRQNCEVIRRTTTQITRAEATEMELEPCNFCNPRGTDVYITRSGRKFHDITCNVINRVTTSLTREEAIRRGIDPCKVCTP